MSCFKSKKKMFVVVFFSSFFCGQFDCFGSDVAIKERNKKERKKSPLDFKEDFKSNFEYIKTMGYTSICDFLIKNYDAIESEGLFPRYYDDLTLKQVFEDIADDKNIPRDQKIDLIKKIMQQSYQALYDNCIKFAYLLKKIDIISEPVDVHVSNKNYLVCLKALLKHKIIEPLLYDEVGVSFLGQMVLDNNFKILKHVLKKISLENERRNLLDMSGKDPERHKNYKDGTIAHILEQLSKNNDIASEIYKKYIVEAENEWQKILSEDLYPIEYFKEEQDSSKIKNITLEANDYALKEKINDENNNSQSSQQLKIENNVQSRENNGDQNSSQNKNDKKIEKKTSGNTVKENKHQPFTISQNLFIGLILTGIIWYFLPPAQREAFWYVLEKLNFTNNKNT